MNTLEKFNSLCASSPLFRPLSASYTFEYFHTKESPTISLSAIVHGNEIIGLDIFNSIIEKIINKSFAPKVNIRFITGNLEAYHAEKRFLVSDMNRSFLASSVDTSEEKRAFEIQDLINGSDLFIDIHQTIEPSMTAFMVFSYNKASHQFARAIDSNLPIVTYKTGHQGKGQTFSASAISKGIPSLTVETGEKGHNEAQQTLGETLVLNAIKLLEGKINFRSDKTEFNNFYTWGETIKNPDFSLELVKRFTNFATVEAGEVLARNSAQEIKSPYKAAVLFPKYGEQRLKSPELIRILKPVSGIEDLT